jgi:antitoxin component YwqK of YwqJK toxin-antitoxin module
MVGHWEYYDKQGNIVKKEFFEYPDTLNQQLAVYTDDGQVRMIGQLKESQPYGHWKFYHKGELSSERYYSRRLGTYINIRYDQSGTRTWTPHISYKSNGCHYKISTDDKIKELINFKNGIKNGKYCRYDDTGKTIVESIFKNGVETTLYRSDSLAPKVNGFTNGYDVQYNYNDGRKKSEGQYWMGYPIGQHKRYHNDDSYSISYFETDISKLASLCRPELPYKIQKFNKDGILIDEREVYREY